MVMYKMIEIVCRTQVVKIDSIYSLNFKVVKYDYRN